MDNLYKIKESVRTILSQMKRGQVRDNLRIVLVEIAHDLLLAGAMRESELASRQALLSSRENQDSYWEGNSLLSLGWVMAKRNCIQEAESALENASGIFSSLHDRQMEGVCSFFQGKLNLWQNRLEAAHAFAGRSWTLAKVKRHEIDFIRASRLQGQTAMEMGHLQEAEEKLFHSMDRAKSGHLLEERIPAILSMAELRRRQKYFTQAREVLEEIWKPVQRAPYRPYYAYALVIIAQLELEAENREVAIEKATQAFRMAWCDGPPYSYHWVLGKAEQLLSSLDVSPPHLRPFKESDFEPMIEVEINPKESKPKEESIFLD